MVQSTLMKSLQTTMMLATICFLTIAKAAFGQPGVSVTAARNSCVDIGSFGRYCSGESINSRGMIVGRSGTSSGRSEAFIFCKGRLSPVNGLSRYYESNAKLINDKGTIVGEVYAKSGDDLTYILRSDGLHYIEDPNVLEFTVTGINSNDVVVGTAEMRDTSYHGFVWHNGKLRYLSTLGGRYSEPLGINNHGVVVGDSESSSGVDLAVEWRNGAIVDLGRLLKNHVSWATGINNAGEICGSWFGRRGDPMAFVIYKGRSYNLGTPSGFYGSFANGINDHGDVVGNARSGKRHVAFVWSRGSFHLLTDSKKHLLLNAVATNNNGQIVCIGQSVQWTHTFLVR